MTTSPTRWPHQVNDRDGLLWTWDDTFTCYRHDSPDHGTILRNAETLLTDHGPLTAPTHTGPPDDPDTIADRVLDLKNRAAPDPGNVFEWHLEHSRATDLARHVLLSLAFLADTPHPSWVGYRQLWFTTGPEHNQGFAEADLEPIADAVTELIILGELSLDAVAVARHRSDLSRECPEVTYGFPAYQQWLISHEVAW